MNLSQYSVADNEMDILTLAQTSPLAFFVMFGRPTPIVFIILPVLLAYIITVIAKKTRNPQMRNFAYIPLAIGVVIGIFAQITFASEPLYLDFHGLGTKSMGLYWGIIIVPIIVALIMFFAGKFSRSSIDADL